MKEFNFEQPRISLLIYKYIVVVVECSGESKEGVMIYTLCMFGPGAGAGAGALYSEHE